MTFELVFTEINLGDIKIPNRIVFPAMDMELWSHDEKPEKVLINFYERVSRGGAGLVFTGPAYPHISGKAGPRTPGLDSDSKISAFKELVESVRKGGAVPGIQLLHAGRYTGKAVTRGAGPVAPSPIAPPILFKETPRELSEEEIWELIKAYGEAAMRAAKAGYSVVEIHGGMGYLPAQFLSPRTNKRRDSWGGELKNRARFLLEVLSEVRRRSNLPVTVRYSLLDFLEDGVRLEESLKVLRWIEECGAAGISIVFGWHESPVPLISREVQPGGFAKYCKKAKEAVEIPVIYATRVVDLSVAEWIIQEGYADMVAMGRALIADPMLPLKQREGKPYRPCIACNRCLSNIFSGRHVSCTVNPSLLQPAIPERFRGELKVAVVGGGPAGMEAARVLALRGYWVTLYEKHEELGGMLRYAAMEPYGAEFRRLIEYYRAELERLGVDIVLNKEVGPNDVKDYDVIILAIGPSLDLSWAPEGVPVTPWWKAFEEPPEKSATIIGSNVIGLGVADFLSSKGVNVTVVDEAKRPGRGLERVIRWIVLGRLKRAGVKFYMKSRIVKWSDGMAFICSGEGDLHEVDAEKVYGAIRLKPAKLDEEWKKIDRKVIVIGNALYPSPDAMLLQAIHSAYHTTMKL